LTSDTIVALATPLGVGAIGIVRMSGREAISIASRLFRARSGKRVEEFTSFRLYLGDFLDSVTGHPLDEALCVVMRAPRSYTREDVVEFHLHGGPLLTRRALELCLREGARMARPGEFTERAFFNGRIDLLQAEAVAEMVRARSEKALQLSLRNLKGEWGKEIRAWQRRLLLLQAHIQASCDFPDVVDSPLEAWMIQELSLLRELIAKGLEGGKRAQALQDGFLVVIAGKPNVGKSSLLNVLLGRNRAIVTPFPGTTRDAIEEVILLEGLPIRFVDTAGIRVSTDPVERIGVEKAHEYLHDADLVIVLFDRSSPFEEGDREIARIVRAKPHLVVLNKSDLPPALSREDIAPFYPQEEIIEISALTGEGKDLLTARLVAMLQAMLGPEENLTLVNARQQEELERIVSLLSALIHDVEKGIPLDLIGLQLDEVLQAMKRLTGENVDRELLGIIFSHFCLGK